MRLLATIAVGLLGCAPKVQLEVLNPAAVPVPRHVRTVAVLDRTAPASTLDSVDGIVTEVLTGEAQGVDKAGADATIEALAKTIDESPRFAVVRFGADLREAKGGTRNEPVPWREIKEICELSGADAVVALEAFDAHSEVEIGFHVEKSTSEAGAVSTPQATRAAEVTASWRYYVPLTEQILDESWDAPTHAKWTFTADTPDAAEARLPDQHSAAREVGARAGAAYGARISPTWTLVERTYYAAGDPLLAQARKQVQNGHWDTAERLWNEILRSSTDPLILGRANYNLALSAERNGDLQTALELAKNAVTVLPNDRNEAYLATLNQRRNDQLELNQQMRDD